MQSELLRKLSRKLVSEPDDYMSSFRKNLQLYIDDRNISMREISEKADISIETLKTLLYGDARDCRLSTAVALAKALEVSVDELVGCGTIDPVVAESIQITRGMPETYVRFIRWAIRSHERHLEEKTVSRKSVGIMFADCNNEGNILRTNSFEFLDISDTSEIVRPKIFMGLRLPCDAYMPYYDEGDILLIANDRKAMPRETVVISYGGFIWLARLRFEQDANGHRVANFYSIRDGKFRVTETDIDETIGYVAAVKHGH